MYRWMTAQEVSGAGLDQAWTDQAAAENWLTGAYLDLMEAGVTAVSLYEEDRLVYGPMSLEP